MKNQLTLLHFDSAEELLRGIDSLQQHGISIHELHSAEPMPGVEKKLRLRQLQLGDMVLRFGCPGGIALTSLIYYFLQPHADWKTGGLNALLLLVSLLFASRLLPGRVPKLFTLKPGDKRHLMVVDAPHMPVNVTITHLFQYTGAIEFSLAIKNIVTS